MKTPRGWQEKQWYPEERPAVDLCSRLQDLESNKYPKLKTWQSKTQRVFSITSKIVLGLTALTVAGAALYVYVGVPWHLQLFSHWLLRKGDIREIPRSLYVELNQLCSTADTLGQVDGYQASAPIAYGLGNFQCKATQDGYFWEIQDVYKFDSSNEALAGTQLAEFLVKLVGSDYTFKIEAIIPRILPSDPPDLKEI